MNTIKKIFFTVFTFSILLIGSCSKEENPVNTKDSSLELTSPNGGNELYLGQQFTIKWVSKNIDGVILSYSVNNGQDWVTINDNVIASTQTYPWIAPDVLTEEGKVRIEAKDNSNIMDVSDSTFSTIAYEYIIEAVKFYPLTIGNKWIYTEYFSGVSSDTSYIYERSVVSDTLMPNGKQYYKVIEYDHFNSNNNRIYWERNNLVDGRTYRYYENWNNQGENDLLIDDLWKSLGSETQSHRYTNLNFHYYNKTQILSQEDITLFGINTIKRNYRELNTFEFYDYNLVKGFGLTSWNKMLDVTSKTGTLKGCVIDGTVYGDTITVTTN
jgi:hypothetical protein